MPASEQLLDDLADAVLDGADVDWVAAETSAEAAARPVVRQLRLVASVARLHREVLLTETLDVFPSGEQGPVTPERWGHLRLLERVGRGAFGEVFRAWDTRLDREVALKLLPAVPVSDQSDANSIIQEGRLLAKVRHPNVVTIHGAEQIGDRIGLWMEFVRGHTLEQQLKQGTVFPPADVIGIGVELCRAVSAVHAAGLLHRDIKAHNVTRAEDGRVVLMDFGTGRELVDSSSSDLAGTPLYLAPEVLAGSPATVQSDIYSLGVLLYHLATGSYPIRGRTIREVRRAHEQNERIAIRTARPDVRPALARAIERATDPQPERRHVNVDALARDLAALQPRPAIRRVGYAAVAAAAVLLVALVVSEVRARLAGDDRGLRSRMVGLIAGTPVAVKQPVIAVLPFKNLGTDSSDSLLIDSITAGLIQQLAIIDGLNVKFQESSFRLRDRPRDLADIGKRLGVNLVVEGDAQLSGDRLLIRATLVSVADDAPVWSDKVDRQLRSEGDLIGAVEDLTRTIVNKLRLKLGRTQRRYDTDIPTLQTYFRARALGRDRRGRGARKAIPLFEEVIKKDPSYAPALAALAATYAYLGFWYPDVNGIYIPPSEAAALAEPLANKALEIDPTLAEAHASMGYIHSFARRWAVAEAEFRRAIDLEPSLTAVYGDFVLSTLLPWGRLDESLSTMQQALHADPLSLDVRRTLAAVQISAGLYDDALDSCRQVLDADPTLAFLDNACTWALFFKGERAEALAAFDKLSVGREGIKAFIYAINGQRAEAADIAARFGHLPQRQAVIYGLLGDKDRALEALERLAAINPMRAGIELTRPEVGLRGDPRVAAFRRKLGFPQ
jgi:TolB-like protein/Tfp pilus assembly protein PilF/tRNA A-37 threonylcarbamoyl transferase component Bud32